MRQWFGQRRRFTKAIPWIATAAALHMLVAAERAYVHARWGRRGVDLAWTVIGITSPIETLAFWLSAFSVACIALSALGLGPRLTVGAARRVRGLVELDFAHPLLVEGTFAVTVFGFLAWRYGLLWRGPSAFFGCLGASLLGFLSVRRRLLPLVLRRARKRVREHPGEDPVAPVHARAMLVTTGMRLFVAASALASVLMAWLACSAPSDHLHDELGLGVLLAYLGLVGGGTLLARHAGSVVIGADGVLVRGVARSRFVAFRDVAELEASGPDLVLRCRGRVLRIQLDPRARAQLTEVMGRVQKALTNARESSRAAVLLEHLCHVDASDARELGRALTAPRGYRELAVRSEDLWAVVEGAAADAHARLSAAIALSRTVRAEETLRLRRAALFCVEPGLTAQMGRLALGDR
jgi:hypothetical protein